MLSETPVVFLLDNDRFTADLTVRLDRDFGRPQRERYWSISSGQRDRFGDADYLLRALQRFRAGADEEPALLQMSAFLLEYARCRPRRALTVS